MATVIIFGGGGYIGQRLMELFPDSASPKADIADPVAVAGLLEAEKPEIVINAAGKTGKPNVDWCEDHKMETLRSNVTGPLVLLQECMKRGIYFVHVGSGCIYAGAGDGSGFTEEDTPNFTGSFYSLTKALSDQALRSFPVLQVRMRMPFDGTKNPRNLLTKPVSYKKVLDVRNSITYMPDFFRAVQALIKKRVVGIYNIVSPGAISPYEIMVRYREQVDPAHQFERLSLSELPGVVRAPRSNCILSCRKLEAEGIMLLPVEQALTEAFTTFGSVVSSRTIHAPHRP